MEFKIAIAPPKRKKFIIGFLDENAFDDYHSLIVSGFVEACEKYDINVIRFGHMSSHITSRSSSQVNMVLDLIDQFPLDGLVFLGWARVATYENHENFIKKLGHIPMISLGSTLDNMPGVFFPGDIYIKEMLLHLIEFHKYKRIAFISPFWTDTRANIYINTLKEHNLYDPILYISETLLTNLDVRERGKKAVSILLDERKTTFDAIVSLYNEETSGVIDELKARGLNVPLDVAVTSYEDGDLGKFSSPSFTTVYFPLKELGYYACEAMHQLLTIGNISCLTPVPGKIIIRDSCGCVNITSKVPPSDIIFEGTPLKDISEESLKTLIITLKDQLPFKCLSIEALLDSFIKEFNKKGQSFFLLEFEIQLRRLAEDSTPSDLKNLIVNFRSILMPFIIPYYSISLDNLTLAENLFQQAQVLLMEKINNYYAEEEVRSKNNSSILHEISQILLTNFSIKTLMDSLEINLPRLSIPGCYIYMFKKSEDSENIYDNYTLEFEYTIGENGSIKKPSISTTNKASINDLISIIENCNYLTCQLLHVGDNFTGFIVFQPGPTDERIYETLSSHISTALSSAILFGKLDLSYKRLVEQAHKKGMADVATGILHNIGNILNSVNVSTLLIKDLANSSPIDDYIKANILLEKNIKDIDIFITNNPKGKKLMQFYAKLGDSFKELKEQLNENVSRLKEKIDLINDIISAQQSYTGIKSTLEKLNVIGIVEDAINMNLSSLEKYNIHLVRNYPMQEQLALVQPTKLFHVLVNIIKNGEEAMLEFSGPRTLTVTITSNNIISISDTGHGIPKHLLESIFAYGYTTKKDGHGFGLHSCANYMTEMEGRLWVESEGIGKGSTFYIQLK